MTSQIVYRDVRGILRENIVFGLSIYYVNNSRDSCPMEVFKLLQWVNSKTPRFTRFKHVLRDFKLSPLSQCLNRWKLYSPVSCICNPAVAPAGVWAQSAEGRQCGWQHVYMTSHIRLPGATLCFPLTEKANALISILHLLLRVCDLFRTISRFKWNTFIKMWKWRCFSV